MFRGLRVRKVLLSSLLLLLASALSAQSRASAYGSASSLEAGAEFSVFNPDFYCVSNDPLDCGGGLPLLKGVGAFGDYDLHGKIVFGAEGEARWLRWGGRGAQVESTYLIGPRFRAFEFRNMGFFLKFLVGVGNITTNNYPGPDSLQGTMLVYTPGGSLDYRLTPRVLLRADYELQKWPDFAVLPPNTHGLTPNGFSFGVAYVIRAR
jgi:Outer membrane protein beta-barrel domain